MKKYLLIIVTAMAAASCNNFLDEDPKDSLTEEEAYGSLSMLKNNTVLDIYNYIGGNSNSQGLQGTDRGVFDLNSITTDEAIIPTRGGDWYDGGLWQRLFTHSWSAADTPLYDTWNYLYKVIMLTNDYIERVENYKSENPSDTKTANEYMAELRAVRAIYYFYTMDLFGRIPLVTSTSASELSLSPRSTTYRFVVDELSAALPYLAESKSNLSGDYYGRVTKPVALAYLAKLTINAEVYSDDDWTDGNRPDGADITFSINGETRNAWHSTIALCDSISNYGYQLESDFTHNFSTDNETSTENIFTIPMNPSLYSNWYNYFFRSRHYCHGAALGGASENGTSATIEILDAMGEGTNSEDPRLGYTFYTGNVYVDGTQIMLDEGNQPLVYYPREVKLNLTGSEHIATAGARLAKYTPDRHANADGRACNNDIVLLRYADILLMKAEAQARLGIDPSKCLNEVRSRVGLPAVDCGGSKEKALDAILNERFVELAWEGWRRNDMIRFGIFANPYTDRPTLANEQSGYTTVFPIPYELMSMHPDWKQNPGY